MNRLVNQAQPEQGLQHVLRGEFAVDRNQVFSFINTPVAELPLADEQYPHFTAWRRIPGVYKPETDMYAYSLGPLDPAMSYTNFNVRRHHERLYFAGVAAFEEFRRLQGTAFRSNGLEASKAMYKDICKIFMDSIVRSFKLAYNVFGDPNLHVPRFVGR